MKGLRLFLCSCLLSLTTLILADGLAPTYPIPALSGSGSDVFSSYNSKNNQFFLTWYDGGENYICFAIYDTEGNLQSINFQLFNGPVYPESDIITSYNFLENKFFLSWLAYPPNPAYAILSADGSVVLDPQSFSSVTASGNVANCFNSRDRHYFLSWTSSDGYSYFAIIDEHGGVFVNPTQIPNTVNTATNTYCIYNSFNNQYLVSWGGSDGMPFFAIFDNMGNQLSGPTGVPDSLSSSGVTSSYNTLQNQYFLTWKDTSQNTTCAIISSDGAIVQGPKALNGLIGSGGDVWTTYNIQNNQFFITQRGSDGMTPLLFVSDAQGNEVVGPTEISNYGWTAYGNVYNCYDISHDKFFISWGAVWENDFFSPFPNGAYYTTYTSTPPITLSGQRKSNRFVNYIEFFNVLEWKQSQASSVVKYNIYRSGQLIATVPATQRSYVDHNQPNTQVTYSIASVDENNQESASVSTTF